MNSAITSHSAVGTLPPLTWHPPIHFQLPPTKPTACFRPGGLLKFNGLRGGKRDEVTLTADVAVGQCYFWKRRWVIFHIS